MLSEFEYGNHFKTPIGAYWLDDSEFDPDPENWADVWDSWVGNETPAKFLGSDPIEQAEAIVRKYVDECPAMFPEAGHTVSKEWLIAALVQYLDRNL